MLNVTELRSGTVFKEAGNIFQVLSYDHVKMGRGSGNIKVKVKNLKTGTTVEKSFMTGSKVDEAQVKKKKVQFLYKQSLPAGAGKDGKNLNFMDPVSFEQFSLPESVAGESAKFLKDGLEVTLIVSGEEALGLELPLNLVYEIAETGPGERGNTVSNVYKDATLENGLVVKVPMFIGVGEKVKVDTRTGQYVERVK